LERNERIGKGFNLPAKIIFKNEKRIESKENLKKSMLSMYPNIKSCEYNEKSQEITIFVSHF